MRPNNVREWLERRPFHPFRIHLTSGTTFAVRHPEQVIVDLHTLNIAVPPASGTDEPSSLPDIAITLLHIT